MKFVIIGLGTFGSSLAAKLTAGGHEVIGVDSKMSKVEMIKDKVTHAICLDSTDVLAVGQLPLEDTDIVVVCIGEDEGASILTTALMKQQKVKRLISRAVSPLHETIMEAMGVDEIVHPEEETAERWAKKFNIKGVVDSFELADEHTIIEARTPKSFEGKTIDEIGVRRIYHVIILTTIRMVEVKNLIGVTRKVQRVQDVASGQTVLEADDILVIYGKKSDIKKFLSEE